MLQASMRLRLFGVLGLAIVTLLPLGMYLSGSAGTSAEAELEQHEVQALRGLALASIRSECHDLWESLRRYGAGMEPSGVLGSRSLQADLSLDSVAIVTEDDKTPLVQRSLESVEDLPARHLFKLARDLRLNESSQCGSLASVRGRMAVVASIVMSGDRELLGLRWLGARTLERVSVRTGVRISSDSVAGLPLDDDSALVDLDLTDVRGRVIGSVFLRLPADTTAVVQGVVAASARSMLAFACLLFLGFAAAFEVLVLTRMGRLTAQVESACAEYAPVCDEFVDGADELACLAKELSGLAKDQRMRLARARSTDEARSAFLANMNYAIRTPMTSILGYGESLQNSAPGLPDWEPAARAIEQSCRDLLRTLDDILDLAKYEAQQVVLESLEFELRGIARDVGMELEAMVTSRNACLDISVGHDVPVTVLGDPTLVQRCLVHLLEYAVHETAGGRIVATMRMRGSQSAAPVLVIEVCDTGAGMSAPDCARVFDAFSLADPSGFAEYGDGLALAIAKRTAQALGGTLDVVTAVGRGTQFTLAVPVGVADRNDGLRPVVACNRPTSLDGIRVLVADDAPDNRRLIGRMLERAGASVVEANDGREACVLALSDDLTIDVILMDLQMPGLDGFEATRRLRDRACTIPVIALSADGEVAVRNACLQVGCDAFLKKPVPGRQLVEVIAASLQIVETEGS